MTLDELKDIGPGQKLQLGTKDKTQTAEFIQWSSDKRLLVVRKYNGTIKQNMWSAPMKIHPSEIHKIGARV